MTIGEAVLDRPDWPGKASRSIRVLNKRSVLDDHGSYWENDEEFLYPLLAQFEIAGLPNTESRFEPAPISRTAPDPATGTEPDSWVSLRRQRVHMLTLWGRLMFVVPLFAAVGEFVLPGFGKLVRSERKAREGRNPATGATIQIPAKTTLKFRVGKAMKDSVLPRK